MTKKQSLKQAIYLCTVKNSTMARAAGGIVGTPEGAWGETRGALSELQNAIPCREARQYKIGELFDALFFTDHADRHRMRTYGEALEQAGIDA